MNPLAIAMLIALVAAAVGGEIHGRDAAHKSDASDIATARGNEATAVAANKTLQGELAALRLKQDGINAKIDAIAKTQAGIPGALRTVLAASDQRMQAMSGGIAAQLAAAAASSGHSATEQCTAAWRALGDLSDAMHDAKTPLPPERPKPAQEPPKSDQIAPVAPAAGQRSPLPSAIRRPPK